MRQVWITKPGGPEVLEVRSAPDPDPGPGQIRVRVKFSGINFADIMARMGQYPDAPKIPCVVGYEVSGVVDALGAGVDDFQEGDEVLGTTRFGGYSDVVVESAAHFVHKPAMLSWEKAAAIPVNYLTAWIMLIRMGSLADGDMVFVHALAGGVGQAALQICQWKGADVIGTASHSKHARLKDLGVKRVIDYTSVNPERAVMDYTKNRGVDIVLDSLGGKSFRQSYRCLAPMGRLCMFGASSFAPGKTRSIFAIAKGMVAMPFFYSLRLIDSNKAVIGCNMGHLWEEIPKLQKDIRTITELVEEGVLDPVVDRVFNFEEAGNAHEYIQDRKNFGKVLLQP
jgi:NADPH:quinone reductase-like Zn-dependent oxidoreductase